MTEIAAAPAYVSDVTGMTESQTAAMRFVDETRSELARNLDNLPLREKHREALNHAIHNGPTPGWLVPKSPEQVEAESRSIDPDSIGGLQAAFAPMQASDVEGLVQHAVVTSQLPRPQAQTVADFALKAQMPAGLAKQLVDRAAKHHAGGWLDGPISEAESRELAEESARLMGGTEKAAAEIALARRYLEHVGGQTLLDWIDKGAGSLAFDVPTIRSLATLARARGIS